MALSAMYILNLEGKLLIHRNYRDVKVNEIELFLPTLTRLEEENCVTPVFNTQSVNFAFLKINDLYIVISMNNNVNIMMAFSTMIKLVEVLMEYIKELEEESIRDNFVIIYELLDEIIDFGYPQIFSCNVLKEYITQNSHKLEKTVKVPTTLTNATSWRPFGIVYKKNEVFVDVVESLNFTLSSTGSVIRSEVTGSIKMKVKLSGMPQLRLGFNDKYLIPTNEEEKYASLCLSDIRFHHCVQLTRFNNDRTISFIPPDGEFELMTYRMDTSIKPLINIVPIIKHYPQSRIVYNLMATSQFRRSSTAHNVEIHIPVPSDVDSPLLKTSSGTVNYVPENNMLVWFIKSFPGGKEFSLTASMRLPSVRAEEVEQRGPIEVSFIIPYFTITGIQVKYLKVVEKGSYKALTWVRYITQNGQFQIRLPKYSNLI